MKNITVSVPDEVLHRARIQAALLNTSVSALVRQALEQLAGEETEFERLRGRELQIREKLRCQDTAFSASDRLSRDEAHQRHALS
jgi:Arc/MetJ-type ribon-helix-helix transcriptional regulator